MDWVKLSSNYYNDPAVMRAGEAAEVLFTRALAYCGDQETEGFIPEEALLRLTPTRAAARAAALVTEGLWTVVDGGWRFVAWERHQVAQQRLQERREANRERQAKHRANRRTANGVRNAVTNGDVTLSEVEEEVDAAAAATREPPTQPLSPYLEVLRRKLEARKMVVRWDKLDEDQVAEIEALISIHGDGPLIAAAVRSYQPDNPPAFAQAWLGAWTQLAPPGVVGLRLVDDPACTQPGHNGTTRFCRECIVEQKAGGR
jgi:hypothetical protein